MSARLAKLGRLGAYALGGALLLLAVTLLLLRAGVLSVEPVRPLLEQTLSGLVARPVSVRRLELRWHGLSPRLFARDVRFPARQPDGQPLVIPEARVQLHLWRSLLDAWPRVRTLAVENASIGLERLPDGRVIVHGLSGAAPRDVLKVIKRLLGQADLQITFEHTRLTWTDRIGHVRYRFSDVHMEARRRGDHYRIGLRAGLPDELGRTLRLTTSLVGELDDPATWRGRSYVRVTGALLAQGEHWVSLGLDPQSRPLLDAELWIHWTARGVHEVAGNLALQDLRLDLSRRFADFSADLLQLDRLRLAGIWRRHTDGWVVRLEEFSAVIDGELLADTDLTLFARRSPPGDRRYELLAGRVEVGPLGRLLQRSARIGSHLDETGTLDAGGHLDGLYAVVVTGAHPYYALSGRFADAHLFGMDRVPGFYGLDGEFSLDASGGEVALYSDDLFLAHPTLGETPWALGHVRALARWSRMDGAWQVELPVFSLSNADLRLEALAWMRTSHDAAPYVALELALHEADLAALDRYLPVRGLNPRVRRWLERSVLGGRAVAGTLSLQGPLDRFPFEHGGGKFRASVHIEDGVLRPSPLSFTVTGIEGELNWYRAALFGHAERFRYAALEGHDAAVAITDLRHAVLELDLTADGPLGRMAEILSDVHRVTHRQDWTRRFNPTGKAALDLALRLPLATSERKKGPAAVHGALRLQDDTVEVNGMESRVEAIEGIVRFDHGTLSGPGLRARLNGVPIRAHLSGDARRGIHLGLEAEAPAEALWPGLPAWVAQRLQGGTRWEGHLRVPAGTGPGMHLRLESDLVGVRVRLPEDLGKPPDEPRHLTVEADFDGQNRRRLWIDYAGRAALAAAFEHGATGWRLERGELRFGAPRANLPPRGFRIRGELARFTPRLWQDVLPTRQDGDLFTPQDVDADLQVGLLRLGRLRIEDLRLRLSGSQRAWHLGLKADAVAGNIDIPRGRNRFLPVVVDLEHLRWKADSPSPRNGADTPDLDPRDLPALKFGIDRLELETGGRLQDVHAVLTPSASGLRLQRLVFSTPGLEGWATGAWRWRPRGGSQVKLQARLEATDVGAALKALRLDEGFRGGSGELELQLQWAGPPWSPRLDSLRGQGILHLEKGRIEDLEPGAARVLGLINPAALPRRVALDFRDLLEKGYRYDLIDGAFTVEGPALQLRGLNVVGPTAELVINGQERLDLRRHDLVVHVTPQLGLGPAIAGTVIGGPAVGAAVFVAERLLKRGGADISRVARVTYRVEGDWNDPLIAPLDSQPRQTPPSGTPQAIQSELLGAD